MSIEVGPIIKKVLKAKGLNHKDLARLINRHEKTIANILKRKTIDTDLLTSICEALDHDFFKYFYQSGKLKALKEAEIKGFTDEIAGLKSELATKVDFIDTQNKYVHSQEEVIRLLKEKEQFLRK